MTIAEMQKVKDKYPQYRDLSDEALLKSVVAKYPKAYGDIADREWGTVQKAPSKIDRVLDVIPTLATVAGSHPGLVGVRPKEVKERLTKISEKLVSPEVIAEVGKSVEDVRNANMAHKSLSEAWKQWDKVKGGLRAVWSDIRMGGGLGFGAGFREPNKYPPFGKLFTDTFGIDPVENPGLFTTVGPLADGIINVGLDYLALRGVPKLAKGVYGKITTPLEKKLSDVVQQEMRNIGATPEKAEAIAEYYIANYKATHSALEANPINIIKSINFLKTHKGFAKEIFKKFKMNEHMKGFQTWYNKHMSTAKAFQARGPQGQIESKTFIGQGVEANDIPVYKSVPYANEHMIFEEGVQTQITKPGEIVAPTTKPPIPSPEYKSPVISKIEVTKPSEFIVPELDVLDLGRMHGIAGKGKIGLNIRLGKEQNIKALKHELGHEIDRQFNLHNNSSIIDEFNMETSVKAIGGNRQEAVGEAINQIILGNQEVINKHPKLVKLLESKIPNLNDVVNNLESKLNSAWSKAQKKPLIKMPKATAHVEPPKPSTSEPAIFNPKDKSSDKILRDINKRLGMKKVKSDTSGKPIDSGGFRDTTYFFQEIEEKSGLPYYDSFTDLIDTRNFVVEEINKYLAGFNESLAGIDNVPPVSEMAKYITSSTPTPLPEGQEALYDATINMFQKMKPYIQYLKIRRAVDGAIPIPKGKEAIFAEGAKVLKEQGPNGLLKWSANQDFVVKDGRYLPAEFFQGMNIDTDQNPFSLYNPNVQARVAPNQKYSDKPITEIIHNYLTRNLTDYYMYDKIKNIGNLVGQTNLSKNAYNDIVNWTKVIKGQGVRRGRLGNLFRKGRGQFFAVSLADPWKWGRNLAQNIAFLHSRYPLTSNIAKTFTGFRKLTEQERIFLNRDVYQMLDIENEFFYFSDELFTSGPIKKLTDMSKQLARNYTRADTINRWIAYKHATAGLLPDILKYQGGKMKLGKLIKKHGLGSFTDLELKKVLSLPPEKARMFIGRLIVEETHFRYKKAERGTVALTELGEYGTSLWQFPKSVAQRFLINGSKFMTGDFHSKYRAAQTLIGLSMMPMLAELLLEKLYGTKSYYDKDTRTQKIYKPYSVYNMITGGFTFGGAQAGQIETLNRGIKNAAELAAYLISGKSTKKKNLKLLRETTKSIEQINETFLPFVKKMLDFYEALAGKRYFKPITNYVDDKLRNINPDSWNNIERTTIEALSHAIFSTEREQEE